MTVSRLSAVALGAGLFLSGCTFMEESLWPSLSGEDPSGAAPQAKTEAPPPPAASAATPAPQVAQTPAAPARPGAAPPRVGTTKFEPTGVTPGSPTGTFVGKKVIDLRNELSRLQGAISAHNNLLQELRAKVVEDSQRYHGTVAAINSRLQVGTTPGNPILVQQFNSSQADLDRLAGDVAEMNKLQTAVASDSTMAAFLAESTRAVFGVSGAVDEDHRQLAILQDEVDRTNVLVDRLHQELTEDIRRQTNYVATERGNLNLLSSGIRTGEIYGASLLNQAMVSASGGVPPTRPAALDTTGRRPLVVVRFDRPDVPYQQALYNAVSRVLDRRPNAVFDLVAVAPSSGGSARVVLNSNKARRNAESVLRALIDMGLPPSRIAVSAKTSDTAKANEVHLYLR